MAGKRVLHIVRHAKSSWDLDGISDIDRPLKLRGIRDAYEMSRRMKINRNVPVKIVCSPANRALHTASIFVRVFEKDYKMINIDARLYGQGYKKIIEVIEEQDDKITDLMIFGHNPDFSDLAGHFAKQNYIDMPTCGIVSLTFEADNWKSISQENALSEWVDFPKKEMTI